jgi:SOS-response transcriptional repressor LexA
MIHKIETEYGRLAYYLKLAGLKQADVAQKVLGIKQPTMSQILSGQSGISDQVLRALELQFGLNPAWVRTGADPMVYPEEERNVRQPLKLARIPILKEIPAGKWESWKDSIPVKLIEGFIDIPELPGKELFAVRMQDSSMEPRIQKGELVIVDPNKVMKELAVVRRPDGSYLIRGIERMRNEYRFKLHALNPGRNHVEEEVAADFDENMLYVPRKVINLRDV